jgi:Zn finger protein HypA/HybF involved in hydrogenase expression
MAFHADMHIAIPNPMSKEANISSCKLNGAVRIALIAITIGENTSVNLSVVMVMMNTLKRN